MAENNLNSSGQIDNLNRIVDNTAIGLSNGNSELNIVSQSRLTSAESLKKEQQKRDELKNLITGGISDLYSFGKSLSNSSGTQGFASLNKFVDSTAKLLSGLAGVAWPVVGDMVGGVIQGAAEVTKFFTGQFSKAYGNFEKLADTGVIATFQDLREASDSIGLTFSDTERVLTKYSRSLAVFGKTAMDGRDRFQNIASASKEISASFRIIGVSSADFAELQLGYIERQTLISRGKNISDKQLAEESIKYMEQLDTLSKITGVSKTELQRQYMDQTRDARYRVWAAGQNKTILTNTDKVMGLIRGLSPELAAGLQDYVSSGGVLTSDMTKSRSAAAALGQGGMSIEEFRQRLASGEDPNLIYKDTVNALAKYSEKTNHIVTLIGKDSIVTKFANAGFDAGNKKDMDIAQIEKDIEDKRAADLANKKSESAKLANTRQQLYDTSKTIDLLATGSDTMASIMNGMATGIETVIEAIFAANGTSLPEYFKIMQQQTKLSKKTAKVRKELNIKIEKEKNLKEDLENLNTNQYAPNDAAKRKEKINKDLKTIKEQIASERKIHDELEKQQKELEIKRIEAEQASGYLPTIGPTPVSSTTGSPSSGPTTPGVISPGSTTSGMPNTSSSTSTGPSGTPISSTFNTTGSSSGQSSESGQQTSGLNRGISIIRELISSVESVGGSYDSIFGGSTNTPLTTMTIAQVLQHQQQMINRGAKSTAAGKYQFIMGSLREYAGKLNMDLNSTVFNAATQDALADILIKEKGYDLYKSGKITANQFLDRLSRAWAGLPSPSKGGQSFYGGDGLNKSHISIEKALGQIGQARTGGIFSGPSTGYLAMLHGDEAVIPANPGSSALEFSTSMDNDETELDNVFSMITDKVDRMISLNRNIISIQRKLKYMI